MNEFDAEELLIFSSSLWSQLQFPIPDLEEFDIRAFPEKTAEDFPFTKFVVGGQPVMMTQSSYCSAVKGPDSEIYQIMRKARAQGITSCVLIGTAIPIGSISASVVIVSDHINLFACNPLIGQNVDDNSERFPDMSQVYDPAMQSRLIRSFESASDIQVSSGIIVGVHDFDQISDHQKSALRRTGDCLLTRELVLEAIAAHSLGMQVGGILVSLGESGTKTRGWLRDKVAWAVRIVMQAGFVKKT